MDIPEIFPCTARGVSLASLATPQCDVRKTFTAVFHSFGRCAALEGDPTPRGDAAAGYSESPSGATACDETRACPHYAGARDRYGGELRGEPPVRVSRCKGLARKGHVDAAPG